ncbi:MAG: HEAT repeat domain-containing protein [Phycisphaerae bacterium]|nr:HEAT repeat domain-containing protein [Phycisphaerae bacterium]
MVSAVVCVLVIAGCAGPKAADLAQSGKPEATQPSPPGETGLESALTILIGAGYNTYYEPSKTDAVVALGVFRARDAVPEIIRQAKASRNQNFRSEAHKALGWIGDPRAVEYLKTAMKDDPYYFARHHAAMALEAITGEKYDTPEHGFKGSPSTRIGKKLMELIEEELKEDNKSSDE